MAIIIGDAFLRGAAVSWGTLNKDDFHFCPVTPKVWFGRDKSITTVPSARTLLTLDVIAFIENEFASFDCVRFRWTLFTVDIDIVTHVCILYIYTLSLRIYFVALWT
jgi:hypothetical protein